jgi:hypothetical protein
MCSFPFHLLLPDSVKIFSKESCLPSDAFVVLKVPLIAELFGKVMTRTTLLKNATKIMLLHVFTP